MNPLVVAAALAFVALLSGTEGAGDEKKRYGVKVKGKVIDYKIDGTAGSCTGASVMLWERDPDNDDGVCKEDGTHAAVKLPTDGKFELIGSACDKENEIEPFIMITLPPISPSPNDDHTCGNPNLEWGSKGRFKLAASNGLVSAQLEKDADHTKFDKTKQEATPWIDFGTMNAEDIDYYDNIDCAKSLRSTYLSPDKDVKKLCTDTNTVWAEQIKKPNPMAETPKK